VRAVRTYGAGPAYRRPLSQALHASETMAKMPLTYKAVLVTISITGLGLAFAILASEQIEIGDIQYKEAETVLGSCINSLSAHGVKFLANYGDEETEDYISLPLSIECNPELLEAFENGHIKIGFYKNAYFGVILNGEVLRSEKEYLDRFNDKTFSASFIFFVIFLAMFVTYYKGKHAGEADVQSGM